MQKFVTFALLALGALGTIPSSATAGTGVHLGTIMFPPGLPNVQAYQIVLDAITDTVTATPAVGAPEVFPYDGATGKGFKKVNEILVPFRVVNETSSTPGVIFWQYVGTGNTYTPRAVRALKGGVIQGNVFVDGIWVQVVINQNVTPAIVTVTPIGRQGATGGPSLTSPVYPQSNMAPFPMGPYLYVVKPGTGTFTIEKWILFQNEVTNGIYTVGYPFLP